MLINMPIDKMKGKVIYPVIKKSGNKKKIEKKYGRVIEKPRQTSSLLYLVTVEFRDGERKSMCVYDKSLVLSVGDEGVFTVQGKTIEKFVYGGVLRRIFL